MPTTPYTDIGTTGKFSIGSTVNPNSNGDISSSDRINAKIDDVRVFDRTMGTVERTALWNASSNGGAD
jgi:hypothetical protein